MPSMISIMLKHAKFEYYGEKLFSNFEAQIIIFP